MCLSEAKGMDINMNIAICDDSREERRELRDILEKLQKDAVITECEDGQELLDRMASGETFDLVFVDIFMNQVGGLDPATVF